MSTLQPTVFAHFDKREIEQSIADRFERQVEAHADRLAVKTLNHSLTYKELNERANRIGRAIVSRRGVQSEPIALLLAHDAPLICTIVGVLKANKFYVPIDPGFPNSRSIAILTDSGAKLIVTDEAHRQIAVQLARERCEVMSLEDIDVHDSDLNLGLLIQPDAPAYILYTSGSTGQPKGVLHTQRNVLHSTMKYTNSACIVPEDRLTLLSRCSLGASVSDLYGAILCGASIYPLDVRELGLAKLAELMEAERITIYHSVPTLFRHFVAGLTGKHILPSLRLIKLGGETVSKNDVELYRRRFSDDCRLLIGYGATELNVIRQYFIHKNTEIAGAVVPVGYAVEDTEVLLLDESGSAVGVGYPGEIAIRSRYLARGYWNRPELTAAKFSADPSDPELCTYRTGDLGSMLADGCLLHLGRVDQQVKIRGQRVDIAEVEAVLASTDGVREAAVVIQEDPDSDRRLVAHVVPRARGSFCTQTLRCTLADKLPEYMIPTSFVLADRLPLTASGKIDRSALEVPNPTQAAAHRAVVKPITPLQNELVHIWQSLLGFSPIGITENFFNLGGNSLLAVRMMDTVERVCGKRLPLGALVNVPTILDLAVALVQEYGMPSGSPLVKLASGAGSRPFYFLHGDVTGCGFYCRDLAGRLPPDQTFYAIPPHGLGGEGVLPTVETMAAENLRAIRAVQPSGPYLLGGHCSGALVAYEMACRLEATCEKVDLLALIGTRYPNSRPAGLRRMLRPVKDTIRRSVRSLRQMVKSLPVAASAAPPSMLETYAQRMSRITRRYAPRPYRGRVIALWGKDDTEQPAADVERDWSRVVQDLEFHLVPGDHHSCLTQHYDVVGDLLSERLRNAQRIDHAHV